MSAAGIIMECNPFHEGHRHLIRTARQIVRGGPVLVVMSSSFVQRGIPAVLPARERAQCILEAGADIVLELPVCVSSAGAAGFARGSISLLARTGIVTDLVFGSESGDAESLLRCADFLWREPEDFRRLLREKSASGLSYPAARAAAAAECQEQIRLPETPNDLLAIEYIRTLSDLSQPGLNDAGAAADRQICTSWGKEPALPVSGSSGNDLSADGISISPSCGIRIHAIPRIQTASASSLRKEMAERGEGLFADDFSGLLLEKLLMIDRGLGRNKFTDYSGVSHDLANRIHHLLPQFVSWSSFCSLLKTRNITYTAVSRAMTHLLLDITADLPLSDQPSCARVLGCRRSALPLLGSLQRNGLQLITGHADAVRLPPDSAAARSLQLDIRAAETWELVRRMRQYAREQAPLSPPAIQKEEGDFPSSCLTSNYNDNDASQTVRPAADNSTPDIPVTGASSLQERQESGIPDPVSEFARPFRIFPD